MGGPSGLNGKIIKLYSFFRRIFKIRWSKAASADPGLGVLAIAIRGFEPRISRRPNDDIYEGLRPDLSPLGVRAAALARDHGLSIKYTKK